MSASRVVLALLLLALVAPVASADWNGDGHADVLAVNGDGALLLYRGNGSGGWITGSGEPIGSGWAPFTAFLAPGDFSGDGKPDLLVRTSDGALLMYRGNGAGGFADGHAVQVGAGFAPFTAMLAPGDFSGDGKPDLLVRNSDGALLLYRGNGAGGWVTGHGEQVGSGWGPFTAIFPAGDFDGDGNVDVFARQSDGTLLLYRGNGKGGWATGHGDPVGSGWQSFTALLGGGDFNGDGHPDVLARTSDGALRLYRGTGSGRFADSGVQVGSGWGPLTDLTLLGGDPPAPPVTPVPTAPAPAPPAAAPLSGATTKLSGPKGCTQPGGRMHVKLAIKRRHGREAPHVRRIVFYVRGGARRIDHRAPYGVKLRMGQPAGTRGRVYARVDFTRGGSRKLRHTTVSRTFVICG